ncbi:MAG: hypothetical protein LBU79_00385 [Planctomycetota bacterium]|jgi:hypothetical protein|nr:hypothetical protein [Planctomycetota bacterium]
MAGARGSLLGNARFLLFCLYVMAYLTLRAYGEVIYRTRSFRLDNQLSREFVVAASPLSPRWRRQLVRAFFSPLMVVEEEGRSLVEQGRGAVSETESLVRDYSSDY